MKRLHFMTLLLLAVMSGQTTVDAVEPTTGKADAAVPASRAQRDWIRTGQSRFDWSWLAKHFDKNEDQAITPDEFPLSQVAFAHMDRSWDGKLTADDFDWSKDGVLCRQKETTFALFKSVDKTSDGRITRAEWEALFAKIAKDKEYLNEEELEQLIYLPRIVKTANEEKLRTGDAEFSPARQRTAAAVPVPGDLAPDFELRSSQGDKAIRLSSFRGKKPVVLIFGCFTCGNYRTYTESLEELYNVWKSDAEFLRVYVREAHPVADDKAATPTNATAGLLFRQPTTFEERCSIADQFTSALHVNTPVVVDEIDNQVGLQYGAWPDRLYIVDREGRVAFTGGPGPFGFNPREMEQSLIMLLMEQQSNQSKAK